MAQRSCDGRSQYKVTYTYDALGQLTSEINVDLGQKIAYTYDAGGNIKTKKIYAYTDGTVGALQDTISYTYDSTWKDKLVTYDGDSITYDAIGNPKTYRDGMSFTWQGRQMKTAKTTSGTSVSYKYNADGLRSYKKVGSTVHEYEYSGDKLFYEKRGDIKFYYRYDVNGNLMSITRLKANGDKFTLYAVCNSRGDVEELRKESGALYARYVYDSWGNVLHIYSGTGTTEITDTANLAIQNPFRYRGYYYDTESGLYYLQSRYYDPVTGRFVNGDGYISTGTGVLGYNMFAYCENNPVCMYDPTGGLVVSISTAILIGSAIVGAATSAYTAYKEYKAGYSTTQIIGDSICNGFAAFSIVYTGGMTLYQSYQNFCYLNGLTPVTDINLSKTTTTVSSTTPASYANLKDPSNVAPGKDFTASQKSQIIQQNKINNNGVVKSDLSGQILVQPQKSMKGVTPPSNEWQIDHIIPKSAGGTNSFSNAQVLSRQENRIKWDN